METVRKRIRELEKPREETRKAHEKVQKTLAEMKKRSATEKKVKKRDDDTPGFLQGFFLPGVGSNSRPYGSNTIWHDHPSAGLLYKIR
jgi:hypothetical protein